MFTIKKFVVYLKCQSKYLVSLLRDIFVSLSMTSDTFSFLEELRSLNLDSDNIFMASFDISLFTNVPLDETIDIIIYRLFRNSTHFLGFFTKSI